MALVIDDFLTNLKSGFQLCVFRSLRSEDFRVSLDQIVLLIFINIFADFGHDFFTNLQNPTFNPDAIPGEGFSIVMLMFACFIISRLLVHQEITFSLSVIILSICPPLAVVWGVINWILPSSLENLMDSGWIGGLYSVWVLAVLIFGIRIIVGPIFMQVALAFLVLMGVWLAPVEYYALGHSLWISQEEESEEDDDFYDPYEALDVEGIYYSQPPLLAQTLEALRPGQKGEKDVFFVGMGAWAFQDVFQKETLYAQDLFDHRFETQNRSLVLINHLSTYEIIPLANSHNLKEALSGIGALMNVDEDLLILYLTSHGSKDHKLSVDFWPLSFNDISPDMLRLYLDEAGIKWRVIMVSACYSGGFIEPLKTPYTAIASAAAPDRKSFGCGNKSQFTYFGEALLKDQLQEKSSFPLAFSGAIKAISERESREGLEESFPQSFVGDEMEMYLHEFAERLKRTSAIKMAQSR